MASHSTSIATTNNTNQNSNANNAIIPVSKQNFDLNTLPDPSAYLKLKETVGSGTYGDVYKAEELRTGKIVAVKAIKLEPGDNFSLIQQEILMMKNCHHPNIVGFYGTYLKRNRLWICMEFCGGGSLQDIYHLTGPLTEPQISLVCREILKGLSYLHSLGMMHRDIKGANILLTADGDVKLADFGVSAQITATMHKRSSFIGSPYWMAPEVAAVERKGGYNQQCDIWSVGITAIELYELQPPMFDLHPMKALHIMSRPNFKPPSLKDKYKCSEHYKNFVKSALVRSAKKRPSAEKLLEHPFVYLEMPKQLMRDLLTKVASANECNFFNLGETDIDDERLLMDIPRKINSARASDNSQFNNSIKQNETNQGFRDKGGTVTANSLAKYSDATDLLEHSSSPELPSTPPPVPPRKKNRKKQVSIADLDIGCHSEDNDQFNDSINQNDETIREFRDKGGTVTANSLAKYSDAKDLLEHNSSPELPATPPPIPPRKKNKKKPVSIADLDIGQGSDDD